MAGSKKFVFYPVVDEFARFRAEALVALMNNGDSDSAWGAKAEYGHMWLASEGRRPKHNPNPIPNPILTLAPTLALIRPHEARFRRQAA